ncbi:restriction endonuclease subunit S [Pediococcus pentosaceus]|uniref:restriction endonuclease subunit S n=1 Tax=Pediococcus pentosaceus TaxID=1255 RepID=UPI003F21A5CD
METKLVKLGDIISLNYGKSLTKKNRIPGDVPVYGSSGITDYHDKPLVDAPSLIIGRKGSIGSVFLSEVPFYPIDTTYFAKESDLNGLDLHFAYYFLKFLPLSEMNTDSAIPGLNRNNFYSLDVVIPDIKSQKIIAFLLDQISYKIKINQQINKNLLRLAKQQFNLTFPNVHEGNSRLSDVMENFDRKRIPLARREREKRQGVYRYVGATSVLDYVDDYLFDGTYLLMGEDGTVQDEKGFPILQYIWGKFWPNNHTHVLSGTFVSTEWLYLFLMNTNVRSRITGAVQQKISQANMNSIPLTIPSKDELFRFQKQIEPVFSQIQLLDEQNLKLTAIHKLLLPKLLAGQIDLSNLEGAIQNA